MLNIQNPRLAKEFIGDQKNIRTLDRLILSGNIPQSLIFCGSKGVGKANTAFIFAKKLLSVGKEPENDLSLFKQNNNDDLFASIDLFSENKPDKKEESKILNEVLIDNNVHNKVEKNIHPDLLVIEMDNDKNSKSISVEKAKEISRFLSLTPSESKYRVAIIDSIDDLTISSSNSILKITEEPNNNAILILITHKISSILPTIRSRCFEIFFNIPDKNEFLEIIAKSGAEYDEKIAEYSGYSPGVYLDMLKENTKEIIKFVDNIDKSELRDIANIASLIKEDKTGNTYNNFKNIINFSFYKKVRQSLKNKINLEKNLNRYNKILSCLDVHEKRNMDFQDTLKEISYQISR